MACCTSWGPAGRLVWLGAGWAPDRWATVRRLLSPGPGVCAHLGEEDTYRTDTASGRLTTSLRNWTAGKQGRTEWKSGSDRGLVACYVDGVAKIRWTNLQDHTYGILDADHGDLDAARRMVGANVTMCGNDRTLMTGLAG